MTHDEMIAVIQAHKEGKQIEVKKKVGGCGIWQPSAGPTWNFSTYNYRIKTEPRTYWIPVDKDGTVYSAVYNNAKAARRDWDGKPNITIIKVKEVLDE